jgi:hypothetical protein
MLKAREGIKMVTNGQVLWGVPVVPVTWEAEEYTLKTRKGTLP